MALIEFTKAGIYCPQADVYIDPDKKVGRAIITHAHADHARRGHIRYLSSDVSKPLLKHRLGKRSIQSLPYGKKVKVNGVEISLHPAGHIPGSAQVRLAYKGEIWVITGDYKVVPDGNCEPFEPVRCTHFVTECTFGLPIYHWPDPKVENENLKSWWKQNAAQGITSVLHAYALGKAQRVLSALHEEVGEIYIHESIDLINTILEKYGYRFPQSQVINPYYPPPDLSQALVITPVGFGRNSYFNKIKKKSTAFASGWTLISRFKKEHGFVMSDHADWNELLQAIEDTGAENIYTMHGYTEKFATYLRELGYNAVAAEKSGGR